MLCVCACVRAYFVWMLVITLVDQRTARTSGLLRASRVPRARRLSSQRLRDLSAVSRHPWNLCRFLEIARVVNSTEERRCGDTCRRWRAIVLLPATPRIRVRVVVFLCAARSEGRTGQRAFLAATPRGFSPLVTASRTGRCTVRGSRGASQHATNDISPVVMTDWRVW